MDRATIRIIDANANRCSEGLRVLEDVARFGLDDGVLSKRVKGLRHEVRELVEAMGVDATARAGARDIEGDVGAAITVASERTRRSLVDVAEAGGKRASESLRVLEECAKIGNGEVAARFERLRYRVYEIGAQLVQKLGGADFTGWELCLVLSESLCTHHGWREIAAQVLEAGCRCVQLREKELSDRELLSRATELVAMCAEYGADCIVNDRVDIALAAGARGVHLGQGDMSAADARRLGPGLLIGVSASSLDEAQRAYADGANYVGVGAMFATSTKAKDSIAGARLVRQIVAHKPGLLPVLAIGGITEATLAGLLTEADCGGFGIAVSSALCGAREPGEVAERMLEMIRGAGNGIDRAPLRSRQVGTAGEEAVDSRLRGNDKNVRE